MKKLNGVNKLNLILIILSLFAWVSCKTDKISPVAESTKDLTGIWKVVRATRNGTDLFPLVDTTNINFNKFTINFKAGAYTLNNPLPFIVTQNGTYSLDNPQYPFQITFVQTGATPIATAFSYPIVNGVRVLTLTFSPGCPQNNYSYSLEKVN
jgi:hypothetical protein